MIRVSVDAMGGDHAPEYPVQGAIEALSSEPKISVLLVGDETRLGEELSRLQVSAEVARRLEVVHADEVVEMDEPAITPIRKKRRSSIRIAAQVVRDGDADVMLSAGNTGAAMIASKMVIGVAEGVDRPALATTLPNRTGWTILLDVGANVDTKPEQLLQFAIMGDLFSQEIVGVERPRVGLLSIGEEEGKGNDVTREVFDSLERSEVNFIGNVEGSDIFRGTVDVVVCDGFVGNVVLKSAETLAEMLFEMIREEIGKSPLTRLGGGLAKPALLRLRRRTTYDEFGGAPLLGLRAGSFIAHGRSNPKAIKNAVVQAAGFAKARIHERISTRLARLDRLAEGA